ncbi:18064_t:CDS:2 [Dentiscutata erythropus]|uniref:18064_t:CDS:1 n=1 Tax=Dentiscutata erythropus TaxID=1348616 RepID=A0A9N9FTP3_9GLOM|nr:18064_t:CDS:2 [Dentiscutata erythropus]
MLRKCWDQDSLKRPAINGLTLNEYQMKYYYGHYDSKLRQELHNSYHATMIYNIMEWKPVIPIHKDAAYKSRIISTSNSYMTRQNDMTLQYEICDIP